jgi:putative hemolysin
VVSAFQQFQRQHSALAIVLDEYDQVSGLITLEDLIEELVGDFADEDDEDKEAIVRCEDGSHLVDGLLPAADLQGRLRIPGVEDLARERSFETAAGLLLVLLGRIPAVGDTVEWQGYRFEVIDMDGQRINKILIRPLRSSAQDQTRGSWQVR